VALPSSPAAARPGASLRGGQGGEAIPAWNAQGLAPTEESRLEAAGLTPYRGPVHPGASKPSIGGASIPWLLVRGLGQTPTLPPAPVSDEPPQPGPVPPATPQAPRGGVRMGPPPAPRPAQARAKVAKAQAAKFLHLADESLVEIRGTLVKAASPAPRDRDRMAARAIGQCMRALARAVDPLGRAMKELRAARDEGRDASLSDDELGALEAFSTCAERAAEERRSHRKAEAAVGGGVPAVLTLALLVL